MPSQKVYELKSYRLNVVEFYWDWWGLVVGLSLWCSVSSILVFSPLLRERFLRPTYFCSSSWRSQSGCGPGLVGKMANEKDGTITGPLDALRPLGPDPMPTVGIPPPTSAFCSRKQRALTTQPTSQLAEPSAILAPATAIRPFGSCIPTWMRSGRAGNA